MERECAKYLVYEYQLMKDFKEKSEFSNQFFEKQWLLIINICKIPSKLLLLINMWWLSGIDISRNKITKIIND